MKSQQVSEKTFIGQYVHILVVSIREPSAKIENFGKLHNCSGTLQQADSMKLASVLCADIETRPSRNNARDVANPFVQIGIPLNERIIYVCPKRHG
jgi:hypothetical protein